MTLKGDSRPGGRGVRLAWLVLLLVATGTAQAATVEGDLAFPEGVDLSGRLDVTADAGGLDLAPALADRAPLRVAWAEARGFLLTSTRDYHAGAVFLGEEHGNASVAWGPGALENLSCAPGCQALLFARPGGTVAASGRVDGPLVAVGEDRAYWTGWAVEGARDSFTYPVGASWLNVTLGEGPATRLAEAAATAEGELGLLLWGVAGDLRAGDASERVETGTTREPLVGPGGVETGYRSVRRALVLHLSGASFEAPRGAPVALLAPAPGLALSGTLRAEAAEGLLDVDGRPVRLEGERLRLDGDVSLAPRLRPSRGVLGDEAVSVASPVRGEADVRVGEARVSGVASPAARLAWGAALLTLLVGLAAWLKAGAGAALYTRLVRSTLLRNPNRRLVLDAVRARPGIHVLELTRTTGLVEGVVRHHLRVLVRHSFLVEREEGRMRSYFALEGTLDQASQEAILALKDPTRRRIAEVVASSGSPLSQAEIAARTGVSARLVSHHLARLEQASLVVSEGSMPRRYAPSPRLAGAVGASAAA